MNDLLALGAFSAQHAVVQMINAYGTIPFPGDGNVITYSRGLLEWVLRQRVQALANVRFMYHQEVTTLATADDGTRKSVTGIHIQARGQLEQQTQLLADLVVDASGRFSKLPQWLAALGYELPEDERLSAGIGYSTRYYKVPQHKQDMAVMVIEGDPATGNATGGVLKVIEDNTWAVCLTSVGGHYPPTDAKGFDAGLTQLISPVLAEMLQGAEPLTEPRGYRLPECVRHHYERMEQWPAGLLVLGDAFCCFDPIYGQGITVAAIEADTLATCLHEAQGQPGFERRTLKLMQEAIYPAWWRSTIEDLRWPGVIYSGPEPLKDIPLLHKYFDLCLKQSTLKLVQLMQKGEFNPLYMNYFLMNWLFISPRSVINASMLDSLLEGETPAKKQAILTELFDGYDQQNIAAILAEAVPEFSLSFGEPSAASTHAEILAS
jgi:2-polyprenyl-6-methoxyphenol hydroxylase-like FAD-dependent oxidoreductase